MNLLKKHKVSELYEDLVSDGKGEYVVKNTLEVWEQPIIVTVLQFALVLAVPILIIVGICYF